MTSLTPMNIQKFQNEYESLINSYENFFRKEHVTIEKIAQFFDEIKYFWFERLDMINFELEELTQNSTCFLLCGAIYLDVSDYEHYYFKSLGDYHFLFDPFLKMENFVRAPEGKIDPNETIDLFKSVIIDTKKILANYKEYFYILPIRELANATSFDHLELLEKFFINFLSGIFNKEFKDANEFCDQFQTIEQIENAMDKYICNNLIFNERDEYKLSLREKIEYYCKNQINFSSLTKGQSESNIFILALYSWLSQISDILLISVHLGVIPYIRFSITFNYLALVMYTLKFRLSESKYFF